MTAEHDIRAWLTHKTGIELERGGVGRALDTLVAQRCRELHCSPSDYLRRLNQDEAELQLAANAVTVVYTWFFRDAGQMAALECVLSELARERVAPLQVWVPGCATGEDCYSIAMLAQRLRVQVQILGSDINSMALRQARLARYPKASLREVPSHMRAHFHRGADGRFQLDPALQRDVQFVPHNLAAPPPPPPQGSTWDLILCRNVLIYFLPESALRVFQGMTGRLREGGVIMLGASEVVYDVPENLAPVYHRGRLVLQRRAPGDEAPVRRDTDGTQSGVLIANASSRKPGMATSLPHMTKAPVPAIPKHAQDLLADGHSPEQPEESSAPVSEKLRRGHEHLDRGELPQALDEYQQAAHLAPVQAAPQMFMGVTRYLSGEVTQAAHDLRAALFLDSELWQAAFYLALSYESLGLAAEALREYEHVVALCERQLDQESDGPPLLGAWRDDILQLARRRLARVTTPPGPSQWPDGDHSDERAAQNSVGHPPRFQKSTA